MSGPIATILPRRKRSPRGRNNSAQKYAGRPRHAGLPGFFCLFLFRLRLLREFRKRAAEFLGGKGPHPGAVVPIGRKQPLGLWGKLRAAAVPPARHRDKQWEAQLALRLLYDGPRLGIGHAHGHGRAPQGMRLTHMAQELRNTGAEAFCFPKDPDADNRP